MVFVRESPPLPVLPPKMSWQVIFHFCRPFFPLHPSVWARLSLANCWWKRANPSNCQVNTITLHSMISGVHKVVLPDAISAEFGLSTELTSFSPWEGNRAEERNHAVVRSTSEPRNYATKHTPTRYLGVDAGSTSLEVTVARDMGTLRNESACNFH